MNVCMLYKSKIKLYEITEKTLKFQPYYKRILKHFLCFNCFFNNFILEKQNFWHYNVNLWENFQIKLLKTALETNIKC